MSEEKVSVQELVDEFYSKPFYLSYSGLNKLLYSPSLFYNHYVLQQREEKIESYLIDGKVIHCLLLDDGSFDQQFILMPTKLPSGNTKLVIDKLWQSYPNDKPVTCPLDFDDNTLGIIEILKEMNLHQSLKTDKQRIDKIIADDTKEYWEFLKISGNKTLLDSETMQRCNEAVDALKANDVVSELLGLFVNEMQHVDIYNEIYMTCEQDRAFGLKGILDNVKVDHDAKIIYLNDLKTTGKTISDFKETVDFFNYWAQIAIYYRLVAYKFYELLKDEKWKVETAFIVIDKYQQVYPFKVSTLTMQKWQAQLEEKLNEAEWHYKERNYKLPYEFANGLVTL